MRNRLDFVPKGMVGGQITSAASLMGYDHTAYRDGPDGTPIAESIPGVTVEVTLAGHPHVYRVAAVDTQDGPAVTELWIDSPEHDTPITADDLRRIARYLDRLAFAAVHPDRIHPGVARGFHEPERPPARRPGRRGHDPQHYADVAEFAKTAHRDRPRNGISVRQAVAARWQVSVHTADKWLAHARRDGLLDPGDLGGSVTQHNDKTTGKTET